MAQQYRKKPVVIEAMEFDGTWETLEAIREWMDYKLGYAKSHATGLPAAIRIDTLEGRMEASVGDYIIKGVQGEFYPCKPDIFEKTYEPA